MVIKEIHIPIVIHMGNKIFKTFFFVSQCIYGCYVHSAILPTFHRRCYWLLQNPDIVLVHYLNVPYPDDNKLVIASSVSLWGEKKEWTKEELISQLKPMCE